MKEKRIGFYFVLFIFSFMLVSYSFSSYAQKRKGEISGREKDLADIDAADPFIMKYKGMYYAYGTSSDRGFEVFYSGNLSVWRKYSRLCLDKEDSYGSKWFWAPEVYYISKYKKFYMFYSAQEHVCVATSDSPLGPFRQELKEPLIEGIDPDLFIDSGGTPYLYFVRFNDGNCIWVAELSEDLKSIKKETLKECISATEPWELVQAKVTEGPSVIRKRNTYYLFYSANDYRSRNYGVGYATSPGPCGPWIKYKGNPILQNPKEGITGTGHGGLFEYAKGKYKYVFHAHFSPVSVQPRQLYLTDVLFDQDGSVSMPYRTIVKLKQRLEN